MEYKVVPFIARVGQKDTSGAVARQLEELIQQYTGDGWEYVALESVETIIDGNAGCFGLGATPPRTTFFKMAVFRR